MGRFPVDIRYKRRGNIWYYKIKGQKFKSSRETSKQRCIDIASKKFAEFHGGFQTWLFKDYAERYLKWEQSPRVRRRIEEGKSITRRYIRINEKIMRRHVLTSFLADMPIEDIDQKHIYQLRSEILHSGLAPATVNKAMMAVRTVFLEGVYRQELNCNPMEHYKSLKTRNKNHDIFTKEELKRLFCAAEYPLIWWKDLKAYAFFFIAAATGMRVGEILALEWRHIDLENCCIYVEQAWKSDTELGLPKSGKTRFVFFPKQLQSVLRKYQQEVLDSSPDRLVFCWKSGTRYSVTWGDFRFKSALKHAGIDRTGRWLTPHSFRHTACTMLLEAGLHKEKVGVTLGMEYADILQRYTHWSAEHFTNQGAIMDTVLNQGRVER